MLSVIRRLRKHSIMEKIRLLDLGIDIAAFLQKLAHQILYPLGEMRRVKQRWVILDWFTMACFLRQTVIWRKGFWILANKIPGLMSVLPGFQILLRGEDTYTRRFSY